MANYDKYIPSGLTLDDSYAIKILICYFLRQIDRPITHNQLIEIATSAGGVNYFTFSEVVAQMLETGMLLEKEIDGEKYYVLSRDGTGCVIPLGACFCAGAILILVL